MLWRRGACFLALLLCVLAPLLASADPVTLALIRRVVVLEKLKARYGIPLSPAEVADIERVKEWNFENLNLINEVHLSSERREWVEEYQRWVAEEFDPNSAEVVEAFWASPRTVMTPKFLRAGGLEAAAKSVGVAPESLQHAVRSSVLLYWPAHQANAVHVGPGLFLTNAHVAKSIPRFLGIALLESDLSVRRASVQSGVLFIDHTLDLALIHANVPKDSFLAGESPIHFSENDGPKVKTVSFSLTATVLENGKNSVVPLMSLGVVGGVGGFYDSHALCTSGQVVPQCLRSTGKVEFDFSDCCLRQELPT